MVRSRRKIKKAREAKKNPFLLHWEEIQRRTKEEMRTFLANPTGYTETELDLSDNQITDTGARDLAEAFKVNTSITSVHLYDNQITDTGVRDLAEAFKVNTSITNVHLYDNQITDTGVRDLADAFKVNTSIKEVDLGSNQITHALQQEIQAIIRNMDERCRAAALQECNIPSIENVIYDGKDISNKDRHDLLSKNYELLENIIVQKQQHQEIIKAEEEEFNRKMSIRKIQQDEFEKTQKTLEENIQILENKGNHRISNPQLPHKECVICLEKLADHICLPCMHVVFCEEHQQQYNIENLCPKCRGPINEIKKVYF